MSGQGGPLGNGGQGGLWAGSRQLGGPLGIGRGLTLPVAPGPKLFTCVQCGKAFPKAYLLKKHQEVHVHERRFRCGDCGKLYKTIAHVRGHRRVHSDERPYPCPECGKRYKTKVGPPALTSDPPPMSSRLCGPAPSLVSAPALPRYQAAQCWLGPSLLANESRPFPGPRSGWGKPQS